MQDRIGEDFIAIILSCTKYGFFVELDDIFIEGLVPIATLHDDRYFFRDTDRQIVGARNGRVFKMGQRVHVLLDRIDRPQRSIQFALLESEDPGHQAPASSTRSKKGNVQSKAKTPRISSEAPQPPNRSPNRSGKKSKTKSKVRARNKKSKGKRK